MNAFSLRRDPVRLALSKAPWSGAWYLISYLFTGTVLFAVALTAVLTGAVLGFTLAGLPVLVAAAATVRWCADVERGRLRPLCPIEGGYRQVTGSGILIQLRTRWRDPATWRDIAYLLGMFVPLVALDLTVLTVWLVFLAGITLPIWYWAHWQSVHGVRYHGYQLGYFPNGPHGHPVYGLYVDTLPKALLAAAISLVLLLLFNYVLVVTVRAHATVARALLGAPEDPLKEAKEILRRPGVLKISIPNGSH
jgi:Putative sensor